MSAPRDPERGSALVTALLIVAVMASVSVGLVDLSMSALQRTGTMDARTQAAAYLDGAQAFTEAALVRASELDEGRLRPDGPWDGAPRVFDIEGGRLAGRVRDASNCLNLNALHDPDGAPEADARAADRIRALFRALGLPAADGEALIAQGSDWIDADRAPRPGGAEDDHYLRLPMPHRAANQPFAEIEELRALPVMTPDLFDALRPHLCVLPEPAQPPLNVNTLRLEEAVMLTAISGGLITPNEARALVFRRPSTGYASVEAFWADPSAAPFADTLPASAVALSSDWFETEITVELDRARLTRRQLVRLSGNGEVRRFTPIQGAVL